MNPWSSAPPTAWLALARPVPDGYGPAVRVAFLGLGRMGRHMAAHVVRAGHETTVWNRSPGRADELVSLGAREETTVADAVGDAEVVVMMLADPASSRAVLDAVADAAPGRPWSSTPLR